MRTSKTAAVLFILALSVTLATPANPTAVLTGSDDFGVRAYSYIEQLSPIPRDARTPGQEIVAATMVQGWFEEANYQVILQPFTYRDKSQTYESQNVVAYLPSAHGEREGRPLVIVAAHYDARPEGQGAGDNASGVGVLLELAERLRDADLDYDLMFVSFGAEEAGLRGSDYFVKSLSQADIKRTIAMINFDSLIAGDKLYIHAGFNRQTWARDTMLDIIDNRDLPIETQPGLNRKYPAGLTPNGFSDYTVFNKKGVPIVAFEATNWEIGNLDGYEETEQYGPIWHTANDVLSTIESLFPGRPMEHLQAFTEVNYEFLANLEPESEQVLDSVEMSAAGRLSAAPGLRIRTLPWPDRLLR